MDLAEGRVGPWHTTGPLGWTFAAGVVGLVGGLGCLAICVAYLWLGSHIPCDEKGRLIASFAVTVGSAAAALPLAAVRSTALRIAVGFAAGAIGVLLCWVLVDMAFAQHFC
jgi:hypothetical protein